MVKVQSDETSKGVRQFHWTNAYVTLRSGQPSVIIEDLVVDEKIHQDLQFTIYSFSNEFFKFQKVNFMKLFGLLEIVLTLAVKMLFDLHESKRLGSALQFLT